MENKEIEIKSEEVLNVLEKYRKLLNLKRFYLKFDENYNKKYFLKVIFKCDYKKYNWENINDGELTIDFSKEKNVVKFGNWSSGSGLVFDGLDKLKNLINMAEELQKIDYIKLNEFREYIAMKDEKKKLQEQKEKIEQELLKKKEEIENKLKELEKGDE